MEARARELGHRHGRKTILFELMEKRGRDRPDERRLGRGASPPRPHGEGADRPRRRRLGAGIASAVNLLDVEAVVIGGGLGTRLGEPYVDRIARRCNPTSSSTTAPRRCFPAALGDLGGAIGAALLVEH